MRLALIGLALIGHVSSFLPSPLIGRATPISLRHRAHCRLSMVASKPADGSERKRAPDQKVTLRDIRASEQHLRDTTMGTCIDSIEALFQRCTEEVPSTRIKHESSTLPQDLPGGALIRVGPNPRPESDIKAFFDGDGMIHVCTIPPPERRGEHEMYYSRQWVRGKGFSKEEEEGECLFEGTLVAPEGWPMLTAMYNNVVKAGQPVKDTANTAISSHGGKILARMEQCCPTELSVSTKAEVKTVEAATSLGGSIPYDPLTGGALAAHAKQDTATGESMSFTYNTFPPGVRYDVRTQDGQLAHSTMIGLPCPIMLHDLAITDKYSVLMDLPLTLKPQKAIFNSFPVSFEKDLPSRIGLVPRYGDESGTLWFDIETCVVLHTINAFERGDGTVVVRGFRYLPTGPHSFLCEYNPAFPYEWVLDLKSGKCIQEGYTSSTAGEFPCMHPDYIGKPSKYVYGVSPTGLDGPVTTYSAPRSSTLYGKIVKYDMDAGGVASAYDFPERNFVVSETTVVPKLKASGTKEDECYLLCITSETQGDRRVPYGSKLQVFDGADLSKGPVASVPLPHDVPYGLHSDYVPWDQLTQ